jgi:DNA-binding Xre family transcriptional regulator
MFKNNISKSELAKKAGISRNTIIKMTNGEPVHLAVILAICDAYGLSLNDVIQEEKKGITQNE